MTAHLLLVTLGPVQEFIAQARRTRDLWYGSHLLSELSRAAARALVEGGAHPVFPALEKGDAELDRCRSPLRPDGTPPLNIANKLLAEVPSGVDPKVLARHTREAVMRFWRDDIAAQVKRDCGELLATGIDEAWDEQIGSFLEFAATWAPLGEYGSARTAVEQVIAARKNLRDFEPWGHLRGNVPKSSLDGSRETVLPHRVQREPSLARKYRIANGEQLDAVGLVKRAGGEPDQFVPVVNVALASWVKVVEREAPQELAALRNACGNIGLSRVDRDLPCAAAFPFDADVLLRSRWKSVFGEQGLDGDPEKWGKQHVGPLLNALGAPYCYVACLVADGDRVGAAISTLDSANEHRAFSKSLAGFAGEARRLVEQSHRGSLVYAGGDDVLAFLPLPEVLACAEALRRRFATAMAEACTELPEADRPTLSVGIGVGHVMESMGDLLALGREAEGLAKRGQGESGDRNALAVIVDKRSGGRRCWRARWDEWNGDPVARLRADAELLGEQLSSRKVYEVARTLRRLPEPGQANESGWVRVLALDVRRSLSRVGAEGGVDPAAVGLTLDPDAEYPKLRAEVSAWVERMLIARTFAMAQPRPRRHDEEAAG
jgi:CRISPR-associated protein Cmr2